MATSKRTTGIWVRERIHPVVGGDVGIAKFITYRGVRPLAQRHVEVSRAARKQHTTIDVFLNICCYRGMKQTMLLKLVPTSEQYQALLDTMRQFNAACDYVASVAFAEKTANKFALQKLVYGAILGR